MFGRDSLGMPIDINVVELESTSTSDGQAYWELEQFYGKDITDQLNLNKMSVDCILVTTQKSYLECGFHFGKIWAPLILGQIGYLLPNLAFNETYSPLLKFQYTKSEKYELFKVFYILINLIHT